jgi:hypothetical protein
MLSAFLMHRVERLIEKQIRLVEHSLDRSLESILEFSLMFFSTVIKPDDLMWRTTMYMQSTLNTSFDHRVLQRELSPDVIGNWSQKAVIEQAAICYLDRVRFGIASSQPMFPEAESLGANDIVTLAEVVAKIGAERFGKALDQELDVNRLSSAVKFGRLNLDKFIVDFDEGNLDSRYFGQLRPVTPRVFRRDKSGFTRREKLEMRAAYVLNRERINWAGIAGTTDDLLTASEDQAHWPTSDELEDQGVDIVALERARSVIGTHALSELNAAGFNLYTLAYRVRYGLDIGQLFAAFKAGQVNPSDLSRILKASLLELSKAHSTRVQ